MTHTISFSYGPRGAVYARCSCGWRSLERASVPNVAQARLASQVMAELHEAWWLQHPERESEVYSRTLEDRAEHGRD